MEDDVVKMENGEDFNTHIVLAVLSLIFCWPLGIVSVIYAARAESAVAVGNLEIASVAAGKARFWGRASIITLAVFIGIVLIAAIAAAIFAFTQRGL